MENKNMKNVCIRFLRLEKKCIMQEKSLFVLNIITVIFGTVNNILAILLPKYLLAALNYSDLKLFVLYLAVFLGVRFLITNIVLYLEPIISKKKEHLNSIVINEFLIKSQNTRLEKFEEPGFYNLYLLAYNKCCDIYQGVLDISMQIIKSLLIIFSTVFILSWVNPWFFVFMCCFVLIQTFLSNKVKKLGYIFNKKSIKHQKHLNYLYRLFYIPEYIRDLHTNSIFDFIFDKKNSEIQEMIHLTYTSKKQIAHISMLSTLISYFEMILVNGYLGYMVITGKIWVDMFITSQNSYSQLENSIHGILDSFTKMYENDLYIKDYLSYMLNDSEIINGEVNINSEDIQTITFNNVSFSYPNTNTFALNNVSFTIKKGEHIFIAGENGAGKTSIVKLLLRLYEPTSGSIEINEIGIKNYSVTSLRNCFSSLLQDSMMYAFSIRENLTFGKQIDEVEIKNILTRVRLLNKINNLKNKLDTPVSSQLNDEGVDFSAGEKQLLILARNYLKRNLVYILDEPTSNLDVTMESNILNPILENNSSTLILISHNLNFVRQMDKIIFLQEGKVVETGTTQQLLNKENGTFLEFYNSYNHNL